MLHYFQHWCGLSMVVV